MIPSGVQLWKLSAGGDRSLGLSCTEEGLFLGRTALIERGTKGYLLRPQPDLERLLGRAYGDGIAFDRVMPGFRVVVAALQERNLCLAQIAALHLRLPELPDDSVRSALDAEDRLIKSECRDGWFARGDWDPAKHPRAGVPPNAGWFAPTDAEPAPGQIVQNEEERAPEEMLDPAASLRQTQWDSAIAALRRIDPANSQLSYVTAPDGCRPIKILQRSTRKSARR
jgi:hypothetical protein